MSTDTDFGAARPATGYAAISNGLQTLRAGFPLWMKVGFWICVLIAVAAVVRRAVALLVPPSGNVPPQLAQLDAVFAARAALTWIHIGCALALVVLLPFLFWSRTRAVRAFWSRPSFCSVLSWRRPRTPCFSVHAVGGMVGALGGVVLQHALRCVPGGRLLLLEPRGRCSQAPMDTARHCCAVGNRDYAACDGDFLRDCASGHTFYAQPVLRVCFLDWVFFQHHCHRSLAA